MKPKTTKNCMNQSDKRQTHVLPRALTEKRKPLRKGEAPCYNKRHKKTALLLRVIDKEEAYEPSERKK